MTQEFHRLLETGLNMLGISVTKEQAERLKGHADLLFLWNRKINLTAIRTLESAVEKHFIDSIAASPCIPANSRLIDIGSGGGFPGIPLAIMRPDLFVTLVDSVRKKIHFLKHVIRTLELENIEAVHARVEDLHDDPIYTGRFDMAISRAFTELANFKSLSDPLVKKGGLICAMKGKNADQEVLPDLEEGFNIEKHAYHLPFEKSHRYIFLLRRKEKP